MDKIKLYEAIDASPEALLSRRARRYRVSLVLYRENAHRLLLNLRPGQLPSQVLRSRDGRRLDSAHAEILRLLYNYLITALGVVDHVEQLSSEVYTDRDLKPDWQKIHSSLKATVWYQLVSGLRQFVQHVGMPELSTQAMEVTLRTKPLLSWEKWKKPAYSLAYKLLRAEHILSIRDLMLQYDMVLMVALAEYEKQQCRVLAIEDAVYQSFLDQEAAIIRHEVTSIVESALSRDSPSLGVLETNLLGNLPSRLFDKISAAKNLAAKVVAIQEVLSELGVEYDNSKFSQLIAR